MTKYEERFKIPYYETDKHYKLTPTALLRYLGEISVIHNSLLVDHEQMEKRNQGWMLNRWKAEVNNYPSAGETIGIKTWISKIDKFYAYREFIIYNGEGVEIGKATAIWIFIDMKRKRPIRIKKEDYNLKNVLDEKVFNDFHRFLPGVEIEEYIEFNVRKSDIDYNHHVNNTVYLDWIMEGITEDIYENYILNEFEIQYKKEIKYPNIVRSGNKVLEEKEDEIELIHTIKEKDSQVESTFSISKWKKK